MSDQKPDYTPSPEEKQVLDKITTRYKEAREAFLFFHKDRFDQYYKNFRDYGEDRLDDLKKMGGDAWMSNLFVPLTASHIRTVHPRVIDSQPEMVVLGRTESDQKKADKVQAVFEYLWERAEMDKEVRRFVWQALVYGTSWGKVVWMKKSRTKFNPDYKDSDENPKLIDEVYYNDPAFFTGDVYDVYPDPLATGPENWRFVTHRYLMTKEEIMKTWTGLKNMQAITPGGNIMDDKRVRKDVTRDKFASKRNRTNKNAASSATNPTVGGNKGADLYEVIEYWEDNFLGVVANGVLIKEGENPYPTKEIPYVRICYEELPFEMYGVGIAEQAEQTQYGVNTIRNQRIDNVTMGIHKMYILNPLALVDERDLTVRPFGAIRTPDPNAVRPIEFGDVKQSAFTEDEVMMQTAKFATGIDDFSRGVGGQASTVATAVTAQKESTAERIKNFVRILETEGYAKIMRLWMSYMQEFYPTKIIERITEDNLKEEVQALDVNVRIQNGPKVEFPLITKDDITGLFDFKIASNSTVAGTQDLKLKKMIEVLDRTGTNAGVDENGKSIVDKRKLWEKVLTAYGWDADELLAKPAAEPAHAGPETPPENPLANIPMNDMAVQLLGQSSQPATLAPVSNTQLPPPSGPSERNGPLPEAGVERQAVLQS